MMVNNNYFKNTPAGKASQARKESHSHETLKTLSLITIFKMPTYLNFYLQPYKNYDHFTVQFDGEFLKMLI